MVVILEFRGYMVALLGGQGRLATESEDKELSQYQHAATCGGGFRQSFFAISSQHERWGAGGKGGMAGHFLVVDCCTAVLLPATAAAPVSRCNSDRTRVPQNHAGVL